MAKTKTPLAQTLEEATNSFRGFNAAFERGSKLARLRRRANHFATPRWKRPLYRLQVRWMLWRHYRHVA